MKTFKNSWRVARFIFIPHWNKRAKKSENHKCDFQPFLSPWITAVAISPKQIYMDNGIKFHLSPPTDEEEDWDHITLLERVVHSYTGRYEKLWTFSAVTNVASLWSFRENRFDAPVFYDLWWLSSEVSWIEPVFFFLWRLACCDGVSWPARLPIHAITSVIFSILP